MTEVKEMRCTGESCPARLRCSRYAPEKKENGKVMRAEYQFKNGKFNCDYYRLKKQ